MRHKAYSEMWNPKFRPLLGACIVALATGACAVDSASGIEQRGDAFYQASRAPTPEAWSTHRTWTFDLSGLDGEDLGLITLEFTDESVVTCDSESARRARLIESTATTHSFEQLYSDGIAFPAYTIHGSTISVSLGAPICDAYISLIGVLSEDGGEGRFIGEGLFYFEDFGTFVARRHER